MPSTNPKVESVSCPGCGAHYDFPAAMSGRRGRCTQCGTEFVVPTRSRKLGPGDPIPETRRSEPAEPDSQYIGVDCPRCQTRMYGLLHQIGQEMKCPDCGAKTVLPSPPPPKKKNIPAAMEGEQYELWETDEAPLPSVLYANQPKYIAVTCRRCDTVMYATDKQVGQSIVCPDCKTKHVVPQPTQPKAKRDVLARDAETPKLDPAAHPGERPPVTSGSTRKMVYEEVREEEYARAVEKSRRTGKPMEIDTRGRPIMPRWPLITGVLPILNSPGVPVRWLAMSVGWAATGWILLQAIAMAMAGGFAAVAGMCFLAMGLVFAMLMAAFTAANLMCIVTESVEGNSEIHSWPTITNGLLELLYFAVSGMLSALPGWLMARFVLPQPELIGLCIGVSMLVCFPIMFLSQLHINSPWGLISPQIMASLTRCLLSWALFYFELVILVSICGVATFFLISGGDIQVAQTIVFRGQPVNFMAGSNPLKVLWLMPLYVATLILVARLIGRLGWLLSEAGPLDDGTAERDRGQRDR